MNKHEQAPHCNNLGEANRMISILYRDMRMHAYGKFIWMKIAVIEMFLLGALSAIFI